MSRETAVNAFLMLALLAVPLIAASMEEVYYVNLAARVACLALAGVGLNFALGVGGMVSLGHAAFFGIGGYVAGVAATHAFSATDIIAWPIGIPGTDLLPLIWIATLALSAFAALVIGALSLRTTGVYFIMITLAFAQMIYYFAISLPDYGGEDGLPIYLRNRFPGLSADQPLTFFLLCFGALSIALLVSWRVSGSRFGAALAMARMNEVRLATSGIAPYPIKLAGFVISAMMTGMAGALFAELNGFVSPSMLSWQTSGEIMIFVILGGVGRLFGPVLGAIAFILLEVLIGGMTDRWQFFLGLILLGVVLFARGGLMGLIAGKPRHD